MKTDYNPKFEKDFNLNLAVYGDYPCKIEMSSHKDAVIFTNDPKVEWPRQEEDVSEYNSLRGYQGDPLRASRV